MRSVVFAILAGLCWGAGEVFTRSVLHTGRIGPVTAIAVRSAVALPVLWLVYWLWVVGAGREPTTWPGAGGAVLTRLVIGSGLLAGAGGMIFFYLAIASGEVSRVKPIAFGLAPVAGTVLAALFLGESITVRKVIAIALVVTGIVLLSGGRPTGAPG